MRRLILISSAELPSSGVFGRDIALGEYRRHLGTTRGDLYYDAHRGLYPNALAALAGTIADGHNLYLHLPTQYRDGDPDHRRLLDYGTAIQRCQANFNARLLRLAEGEANDASATRKAAAFPHRETLTEAFYRKDPFVLLGGRGRGKSHALAEKIRRLVGDGHRPLLVVSPFRENRTEINRLPKEIQQYLCFLSPDSACRKKPSAVHLIIDEAAALPPAQLLQLTRNYPSYTLATTIAGYEGSANTFLTKTLPQLQLPAQAIQTLGSGRRYRENDPLERFITRLFPLQQNETSRNALPVSCSALQIRWISPSELVADETRLAELWQLLRTAHYRTRPEDLKRLLDLPDQMLLTATAEERLLGVASLLLETPLPNTLVQTIVTGERRPRGRLLMQQLLLHTKNPKWAMRPMYRVQRIAVAANARRQGVGTRLIDHAKSALPGRIGVSFCDDSTSHAFWKAQGFTEIRRASYKRSRHNAPTRLWLSNRE